MLAGHTAEDLLASEPADSTDAEESAGPREFIAGKMDPRPFKPAMFPLKDGYRYVVMLSDDQVTWRRGCGATVKGNDIRFDETVTARHIAIAEES